MMIRCLSPRDATCTVLSAYIDACHLPDVLQVELLLTFEEFCAEEGDFAYGEQGSIFADVFPQVRGAMPQLFVNDCCQLVRGRLTQQWCCPYTGCEAVL